MARYSGYAEALREFADQLNAMATCMEEGEKVRKEAPAVEVGTLASKESLHQLARDLRAEFEGKIAAACTEAVNAARRDLKTTMASPRIRGYAR